MNAALARLWDADGAAQAPPPGDEPLPLPHRLAIAYLCLPLAIWLLGYLHWWLGIPLAAAFGAALWPALGGPGPRLAGARRVAWRAAPLALLALLWVLASAAGGFFDVGHGDWKAHRAVLADLSSNPWPVQYADPHAPYIAADQAQDSGLLRYNLGWYIVPGLLGRIFGQAALGWAVPLWNFCGAALLLVLFARNLASVGAKLLAGVVLIAFSGMDALRVLLLEGWDWLHLGVSMDGDWPRIEASERPHPLCAGQPGCPSWPLGFDGRWGVRIMYWSFHGMMTIAPQHFLAAGLYTLLLLLQLRRNRRFLASAAVLLAGAPFWSPFAAIGIAPLALALLAERGIRPFLRWPNLAVAPPLVGVLALYLAADSAQVPSGWAWQATPAWVQEGQPDPMTYVEHGFGPLTQFLPVFYATEFLLLAVLLAWLRPALARDPLCIAAIATLLLLPLAFIGIWNDLSTRASLPALMVLALHAARLLAQPQRGARRGGRAAVAAVLAIGAATPLIDEGVRAFNEAGRVRYDHIRHPVGGAMLEAFAPYRIAQRIEWPLDAALARSEPPQAPRGQLLQSGSHEIYLTGEALAFVAADCARDSRAIFLIRVFPVRDDEAGAAGAYFRAASKSPLQELPDFRGGTALSEPLDFHAEFKRDRGCVAIRRLPEYPIGRIVAARFIENQGIVDPVDIVLPGGGEQAQP